VRMRAAAVPQAIPGATSEVLDIYLMWQCRFVDSSHSRDELQNADRALSRVCFPVHLAMRAPFRSLLSLCPTDRHSFRVWSDQRAEIAHACFQASWRWVPETVGTRSKDFVLPASNRCACRVV